MKKGCFNEKCTSNKKQIKYNEDDLFCSKCGSELDYVCRGSKCYNPLFNVRKKYCDDCLSEREKRSLARKDTVHKVIITAPKAAAAAGGAIIASPKVIKAGKDLIKLIPKK